MQGAKQDSVVADAHQAELIEYRAVSVAALLGLLLALISPVSFGHPVLWSLPLVAVIVNLFALGRISQHAPVLLGRGIALAGLAISLAIGAAAPTQYVLGEARVRYETRQLAEYWFDSVRQRRFEPALELLQEPWKRQPPGENIAAHYRDDAKSAIALRDFADGPLVRALATLGPDAHIRYLQTAVHHTNPFKERVASLWAVTYKEDGNLKSFMVRVSLERDAKAPRLVNMWWIKSVDLIEQPPAWFRTQG